MWRFSIGKKERTLSGALSRLVRPTGSCVCSILSSCADRHSCLCLPTDLKLNLNWTRVNSTQDIINTQCRTQYLFSCNILLPCLCFCCLNFVFLDFISCVCQILSSLANDSFLFLPWLPCSALLLFIVTLENCAAASVVLLVFALLYLYREAICKVQIVSAIVHCRYNAGWYDLLVECLVGKMYI